MKKYFKLSGLILTAALILGVASGHVHARLTGTTGNAETCWGAAGVEVCVDTSGNWIPTTTNVGDLGTSALKWKDLYLAGDISLGDDLVVGDDLTVVGDIFNTPTSTVTVTAGATISLAGQCGKVVLLQTDGASRTTDTTNTFSGGVVGCVYYLYHTGANGGGTLTLDDNALFDVPNNVVLGTGDGAIVACIAGTTKFVLLGTSDN